MPAAMVGLPRDPSRHSGDLQGILMERHSVDEKQAFEMLREQARRTNRKITDIAEAVALSVTLLPSQTIE